MGIFKALSATVTFLMYQQGINQSELARRSGLRPAQISRYLSREVEPKLPQIDRLAQGLGLKLSTFFLVSEQMSQLEKFIEHRPEGIRLGTDDPAFQHLLQSAMEARKALGHGAGAGEGEAAGAGANDDAEESGAERDTVAILFEAQRLIQRGQRLTLEALQQLTAAPPGGG